MSGSHPDLQTPSLEWFGRYCGLKENQWSSQKQYREINRLDQY